MPIVGSGAPPQTKTVRDLLTKAFRTIHVLGAGESMNDDEATDALDILNGVVEQANIDKLMGSYQTDLVVPLVSNKLSYTIGPEGSTPDVIATRPVEILSGFSRRSTIDLPVFVGSKQDYNQITKKDVGVAGWEMLVYYEARWPSGVLYVYPTPLDALTTIYLTVMNDVAAFTSLDDLVSMPPGYRVWLQYKTAMQLAPEYGMTFTVDMISNLLDAESSLKRNNIKPMPVAKTGLSALSQMSSGAYNVYTDTTKP